MKIIELFLNENWDINLFISKWVLIILIIIIIIWGIIKLIGIRSQFYEIDEAEIGIGNSKIKIKPNNEDMQIAYRLWIELSTRKVGLPIDFENDLIVEIYNSWYEFFRITRDLVKEIPVSKIRRNKSTRDIVKIALKVLNEGLRPHLTKWQAKFRKWYIEELKKEQNKEHTPQDIQKKFKEYKELTSEMQEVNKKLIEYRKILEKLAIGGNN